MMWRIFKLYFLFNITLFHVFSIMTNKYKFSFQLNNPCKSNAIFLASSSSSSSSSSTPDQIDLLYDSECPICQMEVDFLKKRDINNKIRFTDLSSPDYNPADHGNVKFAEGMRKIRAVLPNKQVVTGVEVFRQTYSAIGLGWMFALTKLPVIGEAADMLYDVWAENRLRITGRGDMADVLKQKSQELREMDEPECDDDGCGIDYEGLEAFENTSGGKEVSNDDLGANDKK